MKSGEPAGSAEAVAMLRAMESALPESERLFSDRWARGFLTDGSRRIVDLCRVRPVRGLLTGLLGIFAYGQSAFLVARTVFIDRSLESALARGVSQVLILGAGYDSRASRIAGVGKARFFEVDHPNTQARKRELLAANAEKLPANLQLVPVDFNRQQLDTELVAAGFHDGELSFVIWEGVTEYLEPEAVDATLRQLSRLTARGSELIFTYVDRDIFEPDTRLRGAKMHLFMQRRIEEVFRFGMDPGETSTFLAERGHELLEDLAGDDLTQRYFEPLGRSDRPNAYQHIARARNCRAE